MVEIEKSLKEVMKTELDKKEDRIKELHVRSSCCPCCLASSVLPAFLGPPFPAPSLALAPPPPPALSGVLLPALAPSQEEAEFLAQKARGYRSKSERYKEQLANCQEELKGALGSLESLRNEKGPQTGAGKLLS